MFCGKSLFKGRDLSTPLINIANFNFAYDKQTPILDIQQWQVDAGQHLFIYGPSGSGKSTLLNVLTGINADYSGELNILGQDLAKLSNADKDKFRAEHIGVIFQQLNLIPYLSVLDNILLAPYFKGEVAQHNKLDAIKNYMAELNLPLSLLDAKASTLSVGQQQRVAIIRALINKPEIIIADEPTSALDQDARDSFIDLLFSLANKNNSTVIFVSHDRSLMSRFEQHVAMADINQVKR